MQVDWGRGRYERTAAQLETAAGAVVEAAAPAPGERVVDIGCGTGNGALLAAERSARVVGVDPAERLRAVAAERAARLGLDVAFAAGDAEHLPLEDGAADVAISVFGIIFAGDPRAAAAEVGRVLGPSGRLVLSAWLPTGPFFDFNRIVGEVIARETGQPRGPMPFTWHDPEVLAGLLEPHGFRVATEERRIVFTDRSARDYLEADFAQHPSRMAAAAVIEAHGLSGALLFDPLLRMLEAANEDPAGFRITSRYTIATARRG